MSKNNCGDYDSGYEACPCFWGREPGKLIKILKETKSDFSNMSVLDAGCGEGKNAIFFAKEGATVKAIDISELALKNALKAWDDTSLVQWECADIRRKDFLDKEFDLVISYGLLHCLSNEDEISKLILKLQNATKVGGIHLVCAFNDRLQDLSGHPGFYPTLLGHEKLIQYYKKWDVAFSSDEILNEVHPHNNIPHKHSLTRLIAIKNELSG
jgi:tellurite methyltransferase